MDTARQILKIFEFIANFINNRRYASLNTCHQLLAVGRVAERNVVSVRRHDIGTRSIQQAALGTGEAVCLFGGRDIL